MAQTKRKRQTKHRGNAAGMVETRGRTGRKPTAGEKGKGAKPSTTKEAAAQRREERLNTPPTWRGAINRAAVAVVFFALMVVLLFKQNIAAAVGLAAFMMLLYVPLGYYTDLWLYRRRQAKRAAGTL